MPFRKKRRYRYIKQKKRNDEKRERGKLEGTQETKRKG